MAFIKNLTPDLQRDLKLKFKERLKLDPDNKTIAAILKGLESKGVNINYKTKRKTK